MRKHVIIISVFLLFLISSLMAATIDRKHKYNSDHLNCLDHLEVDIEHSNLILTCKYDSDLWVEITPNYRLYISGKEVYLNHYQRRIVADYYEHFMEIINRAKDIGREGAKIGVKGAKIGLHAAAAILKMIVSDYDSDDLEDEIEEETEALEERAEQLEEMAEELEDVVNEFEEIHYTMKSEIEELDDLEWF